MGAAGRAARGGAQYLPADAAAWPQHRRLHAYPESVTSAFVEEATATGIDIFRIFDALNNVDSMRPAIDAVRETGTAVAEVAMSYTGDLSDPGENLYTLDYYLKLAEQIVDAGAHVLAIKDMAGLLRPQAATRWSARCAAASTCRCTCTPTTPRAGSWPPTWRPGRPAPTPSTALPRRWRAPPASPRCRSIVAAAAHTEYDTGLSLQAVCDLEPYWEALRKVYAPFESGLPAPTGRVYTTRSRRSVVEPAAAGDRARTWRPIRGDRGQLRRGGPDPGPPGEGHTVVEGGRRPCAGAGRRRRQRRRIRGRPGAIRHPRFGDRFPARRTGRPAGRLAGAVAQQGAGRSRPAKPTQELTARGRGRAGAGRASGRPRSTGCCSRARQRNSWRTASTTATPRGLSANQFFYGLRHGEEHRVQLERGVELLIGLEAISDPDERGMRTVMCILNGQLRPVRCATAASPARFPPRRRPTGPIPTTSPRRSPEWSPSASPKATRSARANHRHHRGDEDGGRDHRAQAGTVNRLAVSAARRSRAATCWWWSADADRRRHAGRAADRGAAHRHPADDRPGTRIAVQRAGGADGPSTARACSIFTPVRGRSASRRCRAERPR